MMHPTLPTIDGLTVCALLAAYLVWRIHRDQERRFAQTPEEPASPVARMMEARRQRNRT